MYIEYCGLSLMDVDIARHDTWYNHSKIIVLFMLFLFNVCLCMIKKIYGFFAYVDF